MDSNAALLAELLARTKRIEDRLNAVLDYRLPVSGSQTEARARGWHTVKTFAATIGRHDQWVSDRCKLRTIRTLPGGKPYRIPLTEEARFNAG